jgi:hypothetical protein
MPEEHWREKRRAILEALRKIEKGTADEVFEAIRSNDPETPFKKEEILPALFCMFHSMHTEVMMTCGDKNQTLWEIKK